MKLRQVRIQNFRSCEDVTIHIDGMHALVGANNAGKSAILNALDFFFNPSANKVSEETFWNGDTSRQIRVEALFDSLSGPERETLKAYLRPDGTFHVARSALFKEQQDGAGESQVGISQHYCIPMPKEPWLRPDDVSGKAIDIWWAQKDSLAVKGISFAPLLGDTKPSVAAWKEKATEYVRQHLSEKDLTDSWADNPQGYANVLKGTLPHFILVPAVRDLSEETKATKSNPFGKLLNAVVQSITEAQRRELDTALESLKARLNRGGHGRLDGIAKTEDRLNEILREYMSCDLEIEFQPPTLELLLTTPRVYADDGFRNTAENKGHGLQRAIIFTILRCYAEQVTGAGGDKKRTLILAVEEPETYMHPQAQRTIRRVFQDLVGAGDQVLFSTHSALLLDVAYFDELIRVESHITQTRDNKKEVRSRVWQLPMEHLLQDLQTRVPTAKATPESIRELYMNAYHPTRSEGFFARKVILVEGATEQYALPIYAEAIGHRLDELNISVVDCGGKGPMDRLYRIFNELGMACFLLFDYDKDSKEKTSLEKSRELLTLVGEGADPPATTRIGKQAACFPTKWEDTLRSEVDDVDRLESEARRTMGIKDESGKPLIGRYVARKLTSQTPAVIPDSIRRIVEAAVVVERKGTCLQRGRAS